jgi:hypothetical protein
MAILASDVTARLTKTLHDLDAVRWLIPDQWEAIDDAQKSILEARPDLFEVTNDVQLRDTGPKQRVPEDCYLVFDITYNLNHLRVPFSGIVKISRAIMDRSYMGWMASPASPRMEHWMQDMREKKHFWAYPPVSNDPETGQPGWVVMRYAKRPIPVIDAGQALEAPDEMINGVYYFAMTRLLERDEKFAGSPQADMFLQKYAMTIGAKTAATTESAAIAKANEEGIA